MTFITPASPFVKTFSHNGSFFIFDVNTSRVIQVEKTVHDIITDYEDDNVDYITAKYRDRYSPSQLNAAIREIRKAKEEPGLFSGFRPQKITLGPRLPEHIKEIHTRGFRQMLLEVTGNCNLKCGYCPTSGEYADPAVHRKSMSMETCKKAVDFFLQNHNKSEEAVISFYGGEPLLRFGLIRDTLHYMRDAFESAQCIFGITTNGTIMNNDIARFLVRNNIQLTFSIDGPEHIHDRYRVTGDGKASFQKIKKNLDFLARYDEDYFERRVSVNAVLTPPFNIDEIIDFFSNDPTLGVLREKGKIRLSNVDTRQTSFMEDFGLEDSPAEYRAVFDKLVERLKGFILEDSLDKATFERNTIYPILKNLALRPINRLYVHMPPMGGCHIGLKRFLVDTGGYFYICERVSKRTKIGNVESGFDYEAVATLYQKFDEIFSDCKNCWALNLCERCWSHIGNPDEFHGKPKEEFCSRRKSVIEKALEVYTELLAIDPDCLKVFDESGTD